MDHGSGSKAVNAEAHYSHRSSLTPKRQMRVNETAGRKMEQQIRNRTASLEWNNNAKMEQQF